MKVEMCEMTVELTLEKLFYTLIPIYRVAKTHRMP